MGLRATTSTGVHDPTGAISSNASGSRISASSSMPSMTRGPGRLKYADPSTAKTCPRRTAGSSPYQAGRGVRAHSSDGLRQVEPARHQHQHLGVDLGDRVPGRLLRPLAVLAQDVPAARAPHLLGHPVAGGERRIEPLEADDAGRRPAALAPLGDGRLDGAQALAQRLDEVDGGDPRPRPSPRRS